MFFSSITAFFSLVRFWLPFAFGFSEAGETIAFVGSLNFTALHLGLVVWFGLVSPTGTATPARVRLYSVALHRASSSTCTTFKSLSDFFFFANKELKYRES